MIRPEPGEPSADPAGDAGRTGDPVSDGAVPAPADASDAAGAAGAGDAAAPADAGEVYEELRLIARRWFRGQRSDHTLQPTAVIHEAWLRLARTAPERYADRHHFLAVAATAMKHVLINHARARGAACRGGGWQRVHLDAADRGEPVDPDVLLDLAEALDRLERIDPRKAAIAELRLLGGLPMKAIAQRLGCSLTTAEDHWRTARAWLSVRLEATEDAAGSGASGASEVSRP